MSMGSVAVHPDRLKLLLGYRVMLRLMSFLPPKAKKAMLKLNLHKIFWMAPFRLFIVFLDLAIAIRDVDARTYAKNYWWWFRKRFDRAYHLFIFKKRKKWPVLEGEIFQLRKDGRLGTKTPDGWRRQDNQKPNEF